MTPVNPTKWRVTEQIPTWAVKLTLCESMGQWFLIDALQFG